MSIIRAHLVRGVVMGYLSSLILPLGVARAQAIAERGDEMRPKVEHVIGAVGTGWRHDFGPSTLAVRLAELGPDAVPAILDKLKQPESGWGLRADLAEALGMIGDPRAIPTLQGMLGFVESDQSAQSPLKWFFKVHWNRNKFTTIEWLPPVHCALLKALYSLKAEPIVMRMHASLRADDATSRTLGIACVAWARRVEDAPLLIALLDDGRESVTIEQPIGHVVGVVDPVEESRIFEEVNRPVTLRVQDVAAYTLAELLGIERAEYKLSDKARHEPAELDKLRALAMARLAARSASGEAKAP